MSSSSSSSCYPSSSSLSSIMNNLPNYIVPSTIQHYLITNPSILRTQIQQNGFVHIPNFISPEGIDAFTKEAEELKSEGFHSFETHNIFLQSNNEIKENEKKVEEEDPSNMLGKTFLVEYMKQIMFSSSKILINQKQIMDYSSNSNNDTATTTTTTTTNSTTRNKNDENAQCLKDNKRTTSSSSASSALIDIYHWEGLRTLLSHAFFDNDNTCNNNNNGDDDDDKNDKEQQLHISGDEYGGVYYNFFEHGNQLGWHFDRSEFSTSLILRLPSTGSDGDDDDDNKGGGEFMYWPNSRQFFEEEEEETTTKNNITLPPKEEISIPSLQVGSLYLFEGRRSLHAVSRVNILDDDSDTSSSSSSSSSSSNGGNNNNNKMNSRLNAIFTFNREPNHRLNAYTLQKFFGVDVLPKEKEENEECE